ncbi:aldo/keto reductase [Pseudactinotalea sp. Z1732]|uniref:aldo/keto reductase n=1 Tax=Micrococcales TaxID=85006 RepID=UPI003C7CF873
MDTTTMNSPLVFGAMLLGARIDQEQSFALLDRFVERGGQWVDTANCYTFWFSDSGAGGASEEMLGRWLSARPGLRDQIRLSTKVGAEPLWPGSWPQQREGLSRRAILQGLETSLQRMGVAEVDMFWLHQEDRSTPMAETVEALGELTSSGKVRRVGASNHPAWRVEQARGLARAGGTMPIDALQLLATYLHVRPGLRTPGVEHAFGVLNAEQRDLARTNGLEIWAYSPLMSGSYDNPDKPVHEAFEHIGNTRRLQALDVVAGQTGATRSQVVLAWLLAQGIRPVVGVSTTAQLDLAMEAGHLDLDAEQVRLLDETG